MYWCERPAASGRRKMVVAAAASLALVATARCGGAPGPANSVSTVAELRVGVGQIASEAAAAGLQQVVRNFSVEAIAHITEEGRPTPWVVQGWDMSQDRMSLRIHTRSGVRFHDGTPLTASMLAQVLTTSLPGSMGPAFADVAGVAATNESEVAVTMKQPSSFVLESLEATVEKPGASHVGTGPFIPDKTGAPSEMRANADYYLGRPPIERIVVNAYPSVRAAWADMLRGRLDLLYEVGTDAIGSMQGASSVGVYTFVRPYQYIVVLNPHSASLRSADVRRALNAAIDRETLIRDALDGLGVPSFGPISPRHWAYRPDVAHIAFDPVLAKAALDHSSPAAGRSTARGGGVRFKCLVPADSIYERIALVLKRQLDAVGADMQVEESTQDQTYAALASGSFDAVLVDAISGSSVFRTYQWWHSGARYNFGKYESTPVDSALDSIRHATSDEGYRAGVAAYQQAIVNDPPAIFLAWSERVRAVSTRFDVSAEPGIDILRSIRLWRPVRDPQVANRDDN